MLSQMMLKAVAAAVIFGSLFLPTQAQAANVVKGTGIYRTEQECVASVPAFNRRLVKLGLRLTKPTECEEVLGEMEAYAPTFHAESDLPLVAVTAVASIFPNELACEQNLKAMLRVVADDNETVVEASCVPVAVVEQEEDEMRTGQFQPMVFLLKNKQQRQLAKR